MSRASSASGLSSLVWLNEFRYSLNDFDSMMFGESAGALTLATATCGLPRWFSHDSSYAFQISRPKNGSVPCSSSSSRLPWRGIGNSNSGA
ncbi:hypothetical protein D3C81_2005700 [compost metagenome]